MKIIARKNFVSQRSVSYQSSFDSRPSTAKRSFLSNRTTKASNKSNFKQDQNNSSSLSQAEPQVKLSLRPHSAYVPKKRNINFIQKNIQRSKGSRPNSGVDPGVESRLRYNRNYQAPRRKKTIVIKVNSRFLLVQDLIHLLRNLIIVLIKEKRRRNMRLTLIVMTMVRRLRLVRWRSLKMRPLSTERRGWWSRRSGGEPDRGRS